MRRRPASPAVLAPRPLEVVRAFGGGARQGVLVIHSWWGLTDSFRAYGEALAKEGFVVGLADLFDGRTASDIAEAKALRAMRRSEPMYRTLMRDLAGLRKEAGTERVGLVGFSMGGHWAVWLSQRPELPVAAAVLYYAARAGDFGGSRASYLAHFAVEDGWVSAAARKRMEKEIAKAGRPYRAHVYPGAGHWFAENDRPEYEPAAAALAFARTVGHLRACRA